MTNTNVSNSNLENSINLMNSNSFLINFNLKNSKNNLKTN
jgi:hypothetical protein